MPSKLSRPSKREARFSSVRGSETSFSSEQAKRSLSSQLEQSKKIKQFTQSKPSKQTIAKLSNQAIKPSNARRVRSRKSSVHVSEASLTNERPKCCLPKSSYASKLKIDHKKSKAKANKASNLTNKLV